MKRKFNKYKNLLPVFSAGVLGSYIYFITPEGLMSFAIFYLLFFLTVILTASVFTGFKNSLRYSLSLTAILILRQVKQLTVINFMTIAAINLIFETVFREK